MIIRLKYVGTGNPPAQSEDHGKEFRWQVWREPKVCGSRFDRRLLRNVRESGPQWAFRDETGYIRYIGETWAVAVERLHGYVESYGMELQQELS